MHDCAPLVHQVSELTIKLRVARDQIDEWKANTERVEAQCTEMKAVLTKLLALPCAKLQLMYLDKGIGTATEDAIWLDVRKIVERK